ncbi:MAG: hypothetical protein C5B53_11430 [Candidatus Melainabacteria bacterium]|nr:MAG: hypothetical protein C5B53_11430 [Candidatus Melainabacteria bacterium]
MTDARAEPFLFKPGKPASLPDVLKNFRKVDPLCPPLFALAMNRWLTAFGGSDFSLRALAATISSISVLVVFLLANLLLGRRIALIAALLQAISPFDIAYAQEARMYSLVILTAALSAGAFILLATRRQDWKTLLYAVVYLASTWALINTHYTGLFLWAFEIAAGLALVLLRKDWLLLSWLLIANLIVATLCLPWYPLFQQAASIRTESFYVARSPSWWWPFWGALVRLPLNWIIFLAGKRVAIFAAPIYFLAAAILLPGFLILARGTVSWLKSNLPYLSWTKNASVAIGSSNDELNCVYLLLLSWSLIPALAVWFIDVIESHRLIEITRYVIATAPAIYLVGGVGAVYAMRRLKFGYWLFGLYAAFALANNLYAHVIHQREDWRKAAQMVDQLCLADDLLLVSQYYDIVCLDRYLSRPLRQIGIGPAMGKDGIAHLIVDEIKPTPVSFWLLTGQEGDRVFAMIPQDFKAASQYDLGHALHLRHYIRAVP